MGPPAECDPWLDAGAFDYSYFVARGMGFALGIAGFLFLGAATGKPSAILRFRWPVNR